MKYVCESIDRLATTEIRLPYMQRGIIPAFYAAARVKNTDPLTYTIAEKIKASLREGKKRFGIFTGFYDPNWMPVGESDGPAGAVALAKTLERAGAGVVLYVEKEAVDPTVALARAIGLKSKCLPLSRENEEENVKIIADIDFAIFTEKCGPTKEGHYHLCTGTVRDGLDAPLSRLIEKMRNIGKTTCGIGDNGNELGFGKIYDEALDILSPYTKNLRSPAPDGIVCAVETDLFFPCNVSNLGCYALCAAIALLMGNPSLVHTEDDERILAAVGVEMGLVDGGFGSPGLFVDGVSEDAICAYINLLNEIVIKYFDPGKRSF